MHLRSLRLLCVAAIAAALVVMPLSWVDHGPSLCLIKVVSGHDCPGCGMTRALMHALHGDITGAWQFNWRWILVAPLLLLSTVRWILRVAPAGRPRPRFLHPRDCEMTL